MARPGKWKPKDKISEVELAYAAAAVDGEGCIGIHKRGCRKSKSGQAALMMSVVVSNTDPRLPLWLKDIFGGNFSTSREIRDNRRACWSWCLTGRPAGDFLKSIYPYLVIKKEQADIAIQYCDTILTNGPISSEIETKRFKLKDEMSLIKSWRPEVIEGGKCVTS